MTIRGNSARNVAHFVRVAIFHTDQAEAIVHDQDGLSRSLCEARPIRLAVLPGQHLQSARSCLWMYCEY